MRRLLALAATSGAVLLLTAGPALAAEVQLTDAGFSPAQVTVAPGTTIVWTNASSDEHTVIADDGAWDSGPLSPGDTFSITLRREGTYAYGTDDGAHTASIVVSAEAAEETDPDEPGEPGEPGGTEDGEGGEGGDPDAGTARTAGGPAPVTPVTGAPLLALLAAAGLLLVVGGALVSRPGRR